MMKVFYWEKNNTPPFKVKKYRSGTPMELTTIGRQRWTNHKHYLQLKTWWRHWFRKHIIGETLNLIMLNWCMKPELSITNTGNILPWFRLTLICYLKRLDSGMKRFLITVLYFKSFSLKLRKHRKSLFKALNGTIDVTSET